jgi:hypothetical protein
MGWLPEDGYTQLLAALQSTWGYPLITLVSYVVKADELLLSSKFK